MDLSPPPGVVRHGAVQPSHSYFNAFQLILVGFGVDGWVGQPTCSMPGLETGASAPVCGSLGDSMVGPRFLRPNPRPLRTARGGGGVPCSHRRQQQAQLAGQTPSPLFPPEGRGDGGLAGGLFTDSPLARARPKG